MPAKKKKTKASVTTSAKVTEGGRLQAVIAYAMITAPIVLITEKKDEFARFHAKQAVGFLLLFAVITAVLGLVWWVPAISLFVNFGIGVLLAYVAVGAAQGKKLTIPVFYEVGNWIVSLFEK